MTTHGLINHSLVDARYRYIRYADGTEEFYDHYVDANERVNRIRHPNFREAARNLAASLPATNAANLGGTGSGSRLAEIGADKIVRWEGNPIYDPEDPNSAAARLEGAAWLWNYNSQSIPGGAVACFRRTFTLENLGAIHPATLTATADNTLEIFLNGVFLFSNSQWRTLRVTNVTQLLQGGTNVIAARAINGSGAASPAGFIARLDLTLTNELASNLVSDTSWKASASPAAGWTTNGFDDSSWPSAAIIALYDTGPWAGQTGGGTPVKRETNSIPLTTESAVDLDAIFSPTGGSGITPGERICC